MNSEAKFLVLYTTYASYVNVPYTGADVMETIAKYVRRGIKIIAWEIV